MDHSHSTRTRGTSRVHKLLSVATIALFIIAGVSSGGWFDINVAEAATDCTPTAIRCVGSGQEYTTIQAAVTAAQAGDTVVVHAGTYAGFATARSGTAGSPITITRNETDTVTVTGQVQVEHNYITIDGMKLTYSDSYEGGAALRVGYSSKRNHINVTNCYFLIGAGGAINAYAVLFNADDALFDSNLMEGNPTFFIGLVQSGQRQTVSNNIFRNTTDVERLFNVAASDSVWKNNEIYNFNWTGDPRVHSDIWQTINDGSIAQHNIIENNYVHDLDDMQMGAIETNSTGTNVNDWTWRNNVFANAGTLYLISGNFKFYNNTYYRTGAANQSAILLYKDAWGDASGADFRNNLFVQETNQGIVGIGGGSPTWTHSNNFVANTNFTARSGWSETGGVNGGNPQFVLAATNCITTTCNFKIGATSAAKDQGTTIASVTVDRDGVTRPQGVAYDMGAYEYVSAPTAASAPSPATASTNISTSTSLSWTAGSGATSHGIYFGTTASPGISEYKGNQVGTTYNPGVLTAGTTYYWRIDEVNGSGTTTGTVWNFTTVSPPTSTTTPTSSPTSVSSSGGGVCTNCGSKRSNESTSSSSVPPIAFSTTPQTAPTPSATTTTFTCTIPKESTNDLSTTNLVNLFVSLGIIPQDKAEKACTALSLQSGEQPSRSQTTVYFTTPLTYGTHGADVRALQVFLNTHGFILTASGPGAPGNETDYFGAATFDAVKRFQMAYKDEVLTPVGLTTPSGFFGPATIGKVNELLGR